MKGHTRDQIGRMKGLRDRIGSTLLKQPRPSFRIGCHPLGKDLQRNLAAELRILGPPNDTHPTLADLLDQAVVE